MKKIVELHSIYTIKNLDFGKSARIFLSSGDVIVTSPVVGFFKCPDYWAIETKNSVYKNVQRKEEKNDWNSVSYQSSHK